MRLSTLLLPFFVATPLLVANSKDFINFGNDDTLHGEFKGFTTSGKIIWKNESAEENIAFDPTKVRKIVVNEGKLTKPFSHSSFLTLSNGDTVPGKIIAISDKQITLKTDYAGKIQVPKSHVSQIDFQPLGDKILYRGPYTKEGWKSTSIAGSSASKKKKTVWEFKNFSWVNNNSQAVVMNKLDLPDKFRLSFKTSSSSSSYPTIILLADEIVPKSKDTKNQKKIYRSNTLYQAVGTSLSLRLSSYNPSVVYNSFDEQGKLMTSTLANSVQYRGTSMTDSVVMYDIRYDKENKSLFLYKKKILIGKWDLGDLTDKLKGKKMGFANTFSNRRGKKIVINEIVLSSWNGVEKPIDSMENKDRDTVLLTNGTDRYSGSVNGLNENKIKLKSAYADLAIPIDQIRSLNFATKTISESNDRKKSEIAVRFYGTGKITGLLSRGKDGTLILENPILGKMILQRDFVSAYEFEDLDYLYEIYN